MGGNFGKKGRPKGYSALMAADGAEVDEEDQTENEYEDNIEEDPAEGGRDDPGDEEDDEDEQRAARVPGRGRGDEHQVLGVLQADGGAGCRQLSRRGDERHGGPQTAAAGRGGRGHGGERRVARAVPNVVLDELRL